MFRSSGSVCLNLPKRSRQEGDPATVRPQQWVPSISIDEYNAALAAIREALAAGETYQVNFTFSLSAILQQDPLVFFSLLRDRQEPAAVRQLHRYRNACRGILLTGVVL